VLRWAHRTAGRKDEGISMKETKRTDELLRSYLRWPVFFELLLVGAAVAAAISADGRTVIAIVLLALVGLILTCRLYLAQKNSIMKALVGFAMAAEGTQQKLMADLDLPCAIVDADGNFTWKNRTFSEITEGDKTAAKNLNAMFPDTNLTDIEKIEKSADCHSSYKDRQYRIRILKSEIDNAEIYVVYLYDESELLFLKQETDDKRFVAGLIYLDNYDEATESVDEVRRSLLMALIDRKITQYVESVHGIVKKLEKDKYFFVTERMHLQEMQKDRFDILEQVKTVNIGNEMRITLSIGIGDGGDTYDQNYEYARLAMDMALGRGGDQAVIKNHETIRYFGGKSQTVEKTTRVKARVKAHAFRELMESKDRLIIMGHKILDIDSFGAAVGIWRIAISMGKRASIVISNVNSSVRPMMDRFTGGEYPEDLFISENQALTLMDDSTILVVVDVNRPAITEAPNLLEAAKTIVVFDHHRQGAEIIDHAELSYVEPYASSACEMVAEIVQYIADDIRIRPAEADAMYAGIVIDTHNFTNQTGVRTFEAAAFLRRNGADVTRVRKLFRERIEDYRVKAETIHNTEIFRDRFAIGICRPVVETDSPTVIAAQAANDLLDIIGIKASIVITEYNGKVYLSARSIDEVNVQVMMERLGGGGHRTIAGAQLTGITADQAKDKVKEVIGDMLEKGEIS
jgi:c-di-AMP phosphodiesterase-like protein